MVQASTPMKVVTPEMRSGVAYRPRGIATWQVLNIEIEYIHIKENRFWGFTYEWVSKWHRVSITDPERTLLDLIVRSDLFGGISMAIETINANLEKIDLPKLLANLRVQSFALPALEHFRLALRQVGLHREAGIRQIQGVFVVAHVTA